MTSFIRSSNLVLCGRSDLYSNRKILLIFMMGIIGVLYTVYFLIPTKIQLLHSNLSDINKDKIRSPFQHTLGFIRWNSARLERIPIMEKYRPFFANLHYSIPGYTSQLNYTADGWGPVEYTYKAVGDTMKIILQNYSTIEGLLYFHFDVSIVKTRVVAMILSLVEFVGVRTFIIGMTIRLLSPP